MAKINTRVVTAIIYIVDNTSVLTSEVTWPPLPVHNDSKHLFISRQHSMSNANATSASRLGEVHRHVVSADAERL